MAQTNYQGFNAELSQRISRTSALLQQVLHASKERCSDELLKEWENEAVVVATTQRQRVRAAFAERACVADVGEVPTTAHCLPPMRLAGVARVPSSAVLIPSPSKRWTSGFTTRDGQADDAPFERLGATAMITGPASASSTPRQEPAWTNPLSIGKAVFVKDFKSL